MTGTDAIARSAVALTLGGEVFCSGVLIAPLWVLTAAHCLSALAGGSDLAVSFGLTSDSTAILRPAAQMIVHEAFVGILGLGLASGPQPKNDVALVRMTGAAPPESVPASISVSSRAAGTSVVIAGYGAAEESGPFSWGMGTLKRATMTIKEANASGKELVLDDDSAQGACWGDSGGPLYAGNAAGVEELIGVTSRADSAVLCAGTEGIYTDVTLFRDWITGHVR